MKCQVCLPRRILYLGYYGTTLRTISILIDSFSFFKEFTWNDTVQYIIQYTNMYIQSNMYKSYDSHP